MNHKKVADVSRSQGGTLAFTVNVLEFKNTEASLQLYKVLVRLHLNTVQSFGPLAWNNIW